MIILLFSMGWVGLAGPIHLSTSSDRYLKGTIYNRKPNFPCVKTIVVSRLYLGHASDPSRSQGRSKSDSLLSAVKSPGMVRGTILSAVLWYSSLFFFCNNWGHDNEILTFPTSCVLFFRPPGLSVLKQHRKKPTKMAMRDIWVG